MAMTEARFIGLPSAKPTTTDGRSADHVQVLPFCSASKEVLLVDVEFRRHMVGIGFARRRLERPEMRAIDLVTLHQADVLQPRRYRFDRVYRIDQHRQVWRHQLGPARPVLIGGIEDVRCVGEVCELVSGIRRVEQVDGNMADFAHGFSTAPRQADDLPVSEFNEMR